MLATSFLPYGARKVFPCFDEPELKAIFDVTIQHPLKTFILSNSPQAVNTALI